jgi:hypothetical protein
MGEEVVTIVDVGQLAQAGAIAITSSIATGLWGQVQARVAKLFSGGDSEREQVAASELEELRRAWAEADERGQAELVAELRQRLMERLQDDHGLAEQFNALVTEVHHHVEQGRPATVIHQQATAKGNVIQAGHDVIEDSRWRDR